MNLDIIAQLVALMESSSLSTLEVESNGLRVRMESNQWHQGNALPEGHASLLAGNLAAVHTTEKNIIGKEIETMVSNELIEAEIALGDREITSPMVGTFHELKNHPLQIGSKVKNGDVVCIIEAMKVMNEIIAEEDGIITWIACEEGDMVEYGQTLFRYQ